MTFPFFRAHATIRRVSVRRKRAVMPHACGALLAAPDVALPTAIIRELQQDLRAQDHVRRILVQTCVAHEETVVRLAAMGAFAVEVWAEGDVVNDVHEETVHGVKLVHAVDDPGQAWLVVHGPCGCLRRGPL